MEKYLEKAVLKQKDQTVEPRTKVAPLKKKRKPARKQVANHKPIDDIAPQTGQVWNIWYGKWSGGSRDDDQYNQSKAETRCNLAKDSGYTRGDSNKDSFFCLFFARGNCPKGWECEYLHRIPTVTDIFNPNVDCFGRSKHADYREDMGGVGSFLRQNCTLYVAKIVPTEDIEEVVARHFQEWGEIERIRVLNTRGMAFVTFRHEANAQFAKEAMAHQSLDSNETLSVRWASHNPDPLAIKREARKMEEQAAEAIRKLLPKNYLAEIEGKSSGIEARKKRAIEGSFDLTGYIPSEKLWYARGKGAVNPELQTLSEEITTDDSTIKQESTFFKPEIIKKFRKMQQKTSGLSLDYASDEST